MNTQEQQKATKLAQELIAFSQSLLDGINLSDEDIIDLQEITKEIRELNPPKQTTTL
jgi:hypothetical protein